MILHYITDRRQIPGDEAARQRALLARIGALAEAGIDLVTLREKDLTARALETLAGQAVERVAGTGARLLIHSRADVAISAGGHGVHLGSGEESLPASEARVILAKAGLAGAMVAVSCHTRVEIALAESEGADLAVFAPVFAKESVPNPRGLADLADVCARPQTPGSRMPVLALGGVSAANASQCLAAGAAGIAAIRLFQQAESPKELIRELRELRGNDGVPRARPHPYGHTT